ncbi:MAG TPA: antibiotic biosynthesis monooxygenase family protein [Acetobacteraceae bacterium]|nr:antibiotic biosynthesis monooxygenase family protein [Acetobacteraceae bacterium]
MIAVIFEVLPREGRRCADLDLAARLRPRLDEIDGFLSIERFESLSEPGKVLSLSFWRDESPVAASRALPEHRAAQRKRPTRGDIRTHRHCRPTDQFASHQLCGRPVTGCEPRTPGQGRAHGATRARGRSARRRRPCET